MKYLLISFMLFSNICLASTERGTISRILININNPDVAYIIIDGDNAGKPGCATNVWEYALNISTDTGKALYSLAMSSHMAKKEVLVSGLDVCTHFSAAEDIGYLHTI